MKPRLQFATFLAALGTLLAGAASGNTPLAELPLKASVLAKPNVIFAMDDSGSMDWEVLLDTSSGVLWWNGSTAWDSARNKPLLSSALTPYVYLLPVGTAVGGAIYGWNSLYGQAAPPVNQLAWLRSAKFNPIYYDPSINYRPWAPAHLASPQGAFPAGPLGPYANANPAAARAHPAVAAGPTLALGQAWDSSRPNFATNGFRFYVQEGMVLPAGTQVISSASGAGGQTCVSGIEQVLTAAQTVPAGQACWASIPYYPATFWHVQACVLGPDCVNSPDGSGTTLKRYEIRANTPGTPYPGGKNRTSAEELQNFANWFTYYRKRKLMLAASMGEVLENTTGLRLGVLPFNVNTPVTMFDADAPAAANNRFAAAGPFYVNSMAQLGTPTHQAMRNIAEQYDTRRDPGPSVVEYACQRNNSFVVTDGFSNTATSAVPPYDPARWGAVPPYAVTPPGSLADLALAHYTRRLRADLPAGRLPASGSTAPNADKNTDLHINTYGLTLGVRGTVWPSANDPFVSPPLWPTPVANTPSMVDDLWHATINGRGQMYLATTPEETAAKIRAGLDDILDEQGSESGVSVSTVNLTRGDGYAYLATYNPAGWVGDLEAREINAATGQVADTPVWTASTLLAARPWTSRVIASWSGSAGASFNEAAVGGRVNPAGAWGNTSEVMAYLRGDRSLEGNRFRSRRGLLGAAINAEPAIDRDTKVAYLSTGEGMLHAFDTTKGADAGTELWAYVPGLKLDNLGRTTARRYSFRTQADGTPVIRRTESGMKLLVSGMGVAGRGYFALDVTQPRGLTEASLASKVRWEFPSGGDATTAMKMGQSVGRPAIVRLPTGSSAVLLSSGYNNTFDGKGRLWVLDPATGNVLKEYVTPDGAVGAEAGLAQFSPYAEANGTVRYVYAGDLLGNVWRFDLSLAANATGAVNRIAQLRDAAGKAQPVTAAPELLAWRNQRVVLVGTGRLLDIGDFNSTDVQSFYAIADGSTITNARSILVPRVLSLAGTGSVTGAAVDWATQRGWFVDLPAGEHVDNRPTLAYGAVAFITNRTGGSDCSASSRLILINATTGDRFSGSPFVSTVLSPTANASGLTTVLTRDGRLSFTTRDDKGKVITRAVNPALVIDPQKNSWREIRR